MEVYDYDSEDFDKIRNINDGIYKWLDSKRAEYISGGYVIEDLIKELELCAENGEHPWEVMND
jgi:hypothetical protein